MAKDYKLIVQDTRSYYGELAKEIPEALEKFYALSKAAVADGVLDSKTKELIALAIGVTRRCDGCIGAHARAAREAGATRKEVGEALAVAIAMNGGPGLVYSADALRAFDQAGN
jgi:AhpD family alkylhydroperoxidase